MSIVQLTDHKLQAGIKFSIFEAEPLAHYRPREWSMGIHWGLPLLEKLLPADLTARLKEAQNDPFLDHPHEDTLPIYNGKTGEIMRALPVPRTIRVSRRKMRAFCSQQIDVQVRAIVCATLALLGTKNMQYGKKLVDIEYGPDGVGLTATFEDGEKISASMIVGADGPRSSVRDLLLGVEKAKVTPLEVVHSNVAIKYNDAEKAKFVRSAHPVFSMVTHPDCFCFIASESTSMVMLPPKDAKSTKCKQSRMFLIPKSQKIGDSRWSLAGWVCVTLLWMTQVGSNKSRKRRRSCRSHSDPQTSGYRMIRTLRTTS